MTPKLIDVGGTSPKSISQTASTSELIGALLNTKGQSTAELIDALLKAQMNVDKFRGLVPVGRYADDLRKARQELDERISEIEASVKFGARCFIDATRESERLRSQLSAARSNAIDECIWLIKQVPDVTSVKEKDLRNTIVWALTELKSVPPKALSPESPKMESPPK